jgi:hypothetical protein
MGEPIIVCPKCHSEIPLTESLAAPLLAATRREYERRIATRTGISRSAQRPCIVNKPIWKRREAT